jgi:hypothetical protein
MHFFVYNTQSINILFLKKKGHDLERDGIPKAGTMVQVKWDQNITYSCTFLGSNNTYVYTVRKNKFCQKLK